MNHFASFALGLTLVLACGCLAERAEPRDVGAVAEVTAVGSVALTAGTIQWVDGTYTSCANRSGNWSLRVSGNTGMDYTALSVTQNNTACVLTLTKIIADQTYTTASPIAMTTSYAGSASQFTGSGGLSFYANALLSSASFASAFTVTVLYSDNSGLLTGSNTASYASVSATSSTTDSLSPNYTLDLTTGALTAVVSDTTVLVQSVSGTANLVQGSTAGTGYFVDQGTLVASPTFAQLDAAYIAATPTAISGSPVQIPASAFGLTGINIGSAVVRTVVIQANVSGVHSYQTFKVTFNCGGACGVCPTGESSKTDSSGMGAASMCCASTGTTLNCNGTCANTLVDASNCGSCGNVCSAATPHCSAGSCVASCPTGSTLCSGVCVNLSNDNLNCGSCGNACATAQGNSCQGGTCAVTCPWTSNDLSYIGTGDFTVSFTMTASGAGTTAVINQRSGGCASGSFWDVTLTASGYVQVETNDGSNDTVLTTSGTVVNDNKPHTILVRRASEWLTTYVDGAAVGTAALSQANWTGSLATMQVDADTCATTYTAAAIQGVCVYPSAIYQPIANGTYELLSNTGYALDDPSGGGAGTNIDQVTYSQTSPNQHWTVSQVNNNQYKILAPNGAGLQGGAQDVQYSIQTYTGATNQLYYFLPNGTKYNIVNVGTGEALDNWAGHATGSGVEVAAFPWSNSNANQLWTLNPPFANGTYEFVDMQGYALDDPSGGGVGTIPDQLAYANANQQWTITQVSGVQYKILATSGAALTSGTSNGKLPGLSTYTGANSQLWTFQQNQQNGSTYSLINVGSGLALDDANGGSGSQCDQWEFSPTGNGNQLWQVVQSVTGPIANGNYAFVDIPGYALDDPSGGGAGTTVDQVTYSGTNQKWAVTNVSGLQYKIIALSGTGAALTSTGSQGTLSALSAYTGATSQLWVFVPAGAYYNVINVGNYKALDDHSGGSGVTALQWGIGPTNANQRWSLVPH